MAKMPEAARADPRLIYQLPHQQRMQSVSHQRGSRSDTPRNYYHPLPDSQMGYWVDQAPPAIPTHTGEFWRCR